MRRFLRLLVGIRPDLELGHRWWHRLAKVVFFITCLGLTIAIVLIAAAQEPNAVTSNVRVLDTLQSFTKAHPELSNSVSSFRGLGEIGVIRPSGHIGLMLWSDDVICSADFQKHSDELARFIQKHEPDAGEVTPAAALAWLKSDGEAGICVVRTGYDFPKTDTIVAYEFTAAARATAFLKALATGLAVLLAGALALLNVYYRGVLYVIFGERKSSV